MNSNYSCETYFQKIKKYLQLILDMLTYNLIFLLELIFIMYTIYSVQACLIYTYN